MGKGRGQGRAYAGFWRRLAAGAIDEFVFALALVLLTIPFVSVVFIGGIPRFPLLPVFPIDVVSAAPFEGGGGFQWGRPVWDESMPVFLHGAAFVVSGIAHWLYYALQYVSRRRATLGMRALGLYIVREDGRRASFLRVSGRYVAEVLSVFFLYIGYFMIGWTARKQGLHDILARTLVVRVRD